MEQKEKRCKCCGNLLMYDFEREWGFCESCIINSRDQAINKKK